MRFQPWLLQARSTHASQSRISKNTLAWILSRSTAFSCLIAASVWGLAGASAFALQDTDPTAQAADPNQIAVPEPPQDAPVADDHDHEHGPDDGAGQADGAAEEEKPSGPEVFQGELRDGDPMADDGSWTDEVKITVEEGSRRLVIDLTSPTFDTVVVVEKLLADGTPDPQNSWRNDDSENGSNSRLDITVPEAGEYRIGIHAYSALEQGPYTLTVHRLESINLNERVLRNEMGAITADDPVNPTVGSNSDSFDIEIEQPSRLTADVWSEDFDTFVMVERLVNGQPDGVQTWSNDDYGGSQQHSHVDADVAPGTYRVTVSPYSAGLSGNYEMRLIASDIPPNAPPIPGGNQVGPWNVFDPNAIPVGPGFAQAGDLGNRIEPGILNQFDRQNGQGYYYDRYEIDAFQGQPIRISLASGEFDTVLRVNLLDENDDADPNVAWNNDDGPDGSTNSLVEFVAPFTGVYRITATTLNANTTGRYELQISQAVPGAGPAPGVAAVQVAPGQRLELGNISSFDSAADDGRHYDMYKLTVVEGETYTLDLNATGFDPILSVTSAHDQFYLEENDDFEGSTTRSLVRFVAPVSGEFDVRVMTYEAGAEGTYQLVISTGEGDAAVAVDAAQILAPPRASAPSEEVHEGALEESDPTGEDGRYFDEYPLEGQQGQQVRIDLTGEGFDAFLVMEAPSGRLVEADDFQGEETRSVLESILNETGTYKIRVTSYDASETGTYNVNVTLGGSDGVDENGLLVPGSQFDLDITAETVAPSGGLGHVLEFEAAEGEKVNLAMVSADFDTMLVVVDPNGAETTYDDSSDANARVELEITAAGRYQVFATSYSRQETGRCTITFEKPGENAVPDQGKRVFGVFIGIAEYPNGQGDLARCDIDAQRMYDLLQQNYGMTLENSALIVNGAATRDAVKEALERIGKQATADDILVFFYSGHGSLFEGPTQPSDPDGLHETLTLADGDIVDDQLAELINASPAGTALVVLDSCYSGGFAKDVVSAPGRMGIFASEEDVLAQVAEDYEAGGYLSRFIVDALLDHRDSADRDKNTELTAFELCHYLGERYRDEVRSELVEEATEEAAPAAEEENAAGEDESSAASRIQSISGGKRVQPVIAMFQDIDPGEDLSFQRLVVDRGGVKGQTVLFAW